MAELSQTEKSSLRADVFRFAPAKRTSAPDVLRDLRSLPAFYAAFEKEMSAERKAVRKRDSNLLREACKFVKEFEPEPILSENVAGIGDPRYGGA
jgi:DNA (cytosine-5)-methyltransferase 1